MADKKKKNLVLVSSFPFNSKMLKGLISRLEKVFNLYFVDLPGFNKNIAPLKDVSLEGYADYLHNYLNKLDLSEYMLGGISFGFCVVCRTNLDKRCKGIVAIEPYLNQKSLKMNFFERKLLIFLINFLTLFDLSRKIWKTRLAKLYYHHSQHMPLRIVKLFFDEIDPETYFKTAKIILKNRDLRIHPLPHALLMNKNDSVIDYFYVEETLRKRCKQLIIVNFEMPHHPFYLTEKYFEKMITKEKLLKMQEFLLRK